MAALMKKMADEICGSLKLMRGEGQAERGVSGERGGGVGGGGGEVNPLFLCLLLLIKGRYYTLPSLFIHSVWERERGRERGREQETDCESERSGIMEMLKVRP